MDVNISVDQPSRNARTGQWSALTIALARRLAPSAKRGPAEVGEGWPPSRGVEAMLVGAASPVWRVEWPLVRS
jgi:hypothetical protein